MFIAYVKKAKEEFAEGEYPFSVVHLTRDTQEELDEVVKCDYLDNGYELATAEDYTAETGGHVDEETGEFVSDESDEEAEEATDAAPSEGVKE